ncbi:MAG: FtsX-like permease family protein [Clostridiales bacterium]|jgi:putative ABC transport system permease protein|nr:FtsX-like permease family protein [Clostridiales bacterium]
MFSLAVKQLKKNKKRTLITVIGIILSVSMLTAVSGLVEATREMMRQTYIMHGGNYHVGFSPVTEAQANDIIADARVESGYTQTNAETGETWVLFRIRGVGRNYEEVTVQIAGSYAPDAVNFRYNKELMATEGVIAGDNSLTTMYSIGIVLGLIIIAGSVIVIANAFNISASERVRQFGVLKSAGATKRQIRVTVLAEGIILSALSVPLGIAAGYAVEWVALWVANGLLYEVNMLNEGALLIKPTLSAAAALLAALLSVLTVLLSAWFPAGKAAKMSALDAINLTSEIKIKPRQVKTSPLTGKLFGFEGSLAAKALKRNRRKYRATVISLTVSIVLFILGSGFGSFLSSSLDMIYKDFGVNVIMNYPGSGLTELSEISSGLAKLPGAEIAGSKMLYASANIPLSYLTREAALYWEGEDITAADGTADIVEIITADNAVFEQICKSANVNPDLFTGENANVNPDLSVGENGIKGILINFCLLDDAGKRITFKPFNYQTGDKFAVSRNAAPPSVYEIELSGEVSDIDDLPTAIAPYVQRESLNIVVPEKSFAKFAADAEVSMAYWVGVAENPASFCAEANSIFESVSPNGNYYVVNYEQNARITQSINLLITIFIYSFVGMLSLIAVTSVLGTISTNISLRLPEFAMLSSVGMTPRSLKRMLNFESLFYGLKALAFGLPISFVLYYIMYRAFEISVKFAFVLPWQGMLICSAAVFIITFITMRYSSNILRGKNMVELIRNINI